jgi:uncharacterized protein
LKIAVIGSGIAGLGCAYLLQQKHDVQVFEAADYAGGHTHTHTIEVASGSYQVDSGFIVYNPNHYPNFIRLLDDLGVASQATRMSFGVKNLRSGLEYNATSVDQLFCQRCNIFRPSFWRLVRDLRRFYRTPHPLLSEADPGPTVGEYIAREGYSDIFRDDHLVPIASALWSSPGGKILEFPAKYLAQFMHNHHMLNTDSERPPWRVVQGGSQSYTRALLAKLKNKVALNSKVQHVERRAEQFENGVTLHLAGGPAIYDRVVFACHADQALAMLAKSSKPEQDILGGLKFQENDTVLHTDTRIMPGNRKAWAAWNAHLGQHEQSQCTVTYWMNLLQGIEAPEQFLVSLNCTEQIDPSKILRRMRYAHPVYTHQTLAAQKRRTELMGPLHSYFCGAYWGFGFHEDGLRSGVEVAESLGSGWTAA